MCFGARFGSAHDERNNWNRDQPAGGEGDHSGSTATAGARASAAVVVARRGVGLLRVSPLKARPPGTVLLRGASRSSHPLHAGHHGRPAEWLHRQQATGHHGDEPKGEHAREDATPPRAAHRPNVQRLAAHASGVASTLRSSLPGLPARPSDFRVASSGACVNVGLCQIGARSATGSSPACPGRGSPCGCWCPASPCCRVLCRMAWPREWRITLRLVRRRWQVRPRRRRSRRRRNIVSRARRITSGATASRRAVRQWSPRYRQSSTCRRRSPYSDEACRIGDARSRLSGARTPTILRTALLPPAR